MNTSKDGVTASWATYAFTYWEGRPYAFTQLCLDSISRFFGERHVHLTPENIRDWIVLPDRVAATEHVLFRADYLRGALLRDHGGWWFDADILLLEDPRGLVRPERPQIWNLVYRVDRQWVPLVNCGILYSPPGSAWIDGIMRDMDKIDPRDLKITRDNEDLGQDVFEKWSVDTGLCDIGNEHVFNSTVNTDADHRVFWDGTVTMETVSYGLHIGASLSRWAASDGEQQAEQILTIDSLERLIEAFPDSFVAQYVYRFGLPPVRPGATKIWGG